jgi:hypothetical protein
MAKKTAKPASKSPKSATKKKAPSKKATKPIEVELDAAEAKAFELAYSSDKVCAELEAAVTSAVSLAVRKVFKQNLVSLTVPQAEKVAMLLFQED